MSLPGRKKAAVLCVSLGPIAAAEVFRHLPEDMIELLTVEMARTQDVEPGQVDSVLEEVIETAYAHGYIAEGGIHYAREVLDRALGPSRSREILERLAASLEQTPFDFLRRTPPDQIYSFLRHEHPQTIALVVANLPTVDVAAKVMQVIPPELQAEVAVRIARMGQISPDVVQEVAKVMRAHLDSVSHQPTASAGGVKSLAEILNSADRGTERNILEHLTTEDQTLADEVRALLFTFEDILKLDDRSIQLVLKEVDTKELALALRGASEEVMDKILANLSERGAEMLKEEIEFMPPQRRRAVEEAQGKIVAVVRRLEDAGEIVVARGGDEDQLF
jgi:flagellar motor switch protein FliG